MSVPAVSYDVRYRPIGAPDEEWVLETFPAGPSVSLADVGRGADFEVQVRSVAGNGRTSDWVVVPATVPSTIRTGALALPTNLVGNRASMWNVDTSVTYAATSPTTGQGSATVSVSAGTLVIGGSTIAYGASSATITGAPGSERTVYLYYDDPYWQGGSRVLGIAENVVDSANVNGRLAVSALTVKFPAPGGSGGGGGGIGGGGGGGGAYNPVANQVIA